MHCSAQGYGDKSGLPAAEMMAPKQELHRLYPNYVNNGLLFEEMWTKCQESISQACKRARTKLINSVSIIHSTTIIIINVNIEHIENGE